MLPALFLFALPVLLTVLTLSTLITELASSCCFLDLVLLVDVVVAVTTAAFVFFLGGILRQARIKSRILVGRLRTRGVPAFVMAGDEVSLSLRRAVVGSVRKPVGFGLSSVRVEERVLGVHTFSNFVKLSAD